MDMLDKEIVSLVVLMFVGAPGLIRFMAEALRRM